MQPEVAAQQGVSRWILPPGAFRIVLAFLVVVTHSLPLKLGPAAVFLFFMLSGYWIDVMWHREYKQTSAPWRIFMTSRLWRLLPVYLLSLMFYIAVCWMISQPLSPAFSSPLQQLHFYVSNLCILGLVQLPLQYRIVYPGWSLDIELQFYIIAPFIIALAAARKSSFYLSVLAVIAAGFAAYYLVYYEGFKAFSGLMPMYLIFFLIGLATARYDWRPSDRTAQLSLLASMLLFIVVFAFHQTRSLYVWGPFATPIQYYSPAANFVFALVLAPYAMATVRVKAAARGRFVAANDRHFSNLTYDVYLLHPSVITAFNFLMIAHGISRWKQLPFIPVIYLCILLISLLVYHYYDQPIDEKRRDYVKRVSGKAPVSTPQSGASANEISSSRYSAKGT